MLQKNIGIKLHFTGRKGKRKTVLNSSIKFEYCLFTAKMLAYN